MSTKDPNYAVKVEQAIAEKYGEEAVVNPKSQWDEEKEKEYLGQLKDVYKVGMPSEDFDKEESKRSCPVCNTYSFKSYDDVYMTKFECCRNCYIQWIEHREDRWMKGWRPNK